jgi:hypothetical protein
MTVFVQRLIYIFLDYVCQFREKDESDDVPCNVICLCTAKPCIYCSVFVETTAVFAMQARCKDYTETMKPWTN